MPHATSYSKEQSKSAPLFSNLTDYMSQESSNVIAITGAGTGIGKSCVDLFLENNYKVALLGRRKEVLERVADNRRKTLVIPCDVSDAAAVSEAFNRIEDQWGRLDVLFNNAGMVIPASTIDELSLEKWNSMIDVNLTGAFLCARESFRIMRRQTPQGGRIINNGSISAHVPRPGSVAYTSTKHAITGLTRTLSLDGRAFNIACGQIDIGNALTDMTAGIAKGVPQANRSVLAEPTMEVSHVASSVLHMAQLPLDANVQFMTVMATAMPYIGRG